MSELNWDLNSYLTRSLTKRSVCLRNRGSRRSSWRGIWRRPCRPRTPSLRRWIGSRWWTTTRTTHGPESRRAQRSYPKRSFPWLSWNRWRGSCPAGEWSCSRRRARRRSRRRSCLWSSHGLRWVRVRLGSRSWWAQCGPRIGIGSVSGSGRRFGQRWVWGGWEGRGWRRRRGILGSWYWILNFEFWVWPMRRWMPCCVCVCVFVLCVFYAFWFCFACSGCVGPVGNGGTFVIVSKRRYR